VSKQTIKRAALYSTALIVLMVLIFPYTLEQILNSSQVKHKISSLLEQKIGAKIDQDRIDFIIFPKPGFRIREITISFNQVLRLDIGAANVDINMSALLRGKWAASKIHIQTPHLRYTPQKDTKYQPFEFKFPKEQIQHFFEIFPDTQDTLEVSIKNIQTDYFDSMDGSLLVSDTNQSLVFNAQVNGLHVRKDQLPKNSFLEKIDLDTIVSDKIILAVKLEATGILTGNVQIKAPRIFAHEIPRVPLTENDLDLGFQFSKDFIAASLKPIVFSYPNGKVGIDFLDDPNASKTAITFKGNNVDITQAGELCLNLIGSNQLANQLFDILRGGTARDVTVGFTSNTLDSLFAPENLFLTGSAENSLVRIPQTPLVAKNVFGDAVIKKGILHINSHKGQINTTLIKEGWLDVDLLNYEDIPFTGEFNLHSDLSTLPRALISLLPGTQLSRELARIGRISGQADALLQLEMKSQQKELFVKVKAQNVSLKGDYDRIPFPITITIGEFVYEPDKVILTDFAASLKNSVVQNVDAVIDFSKAPRFDISTDFARIDLAQIMKWLKSYDPVMERIAPFTTLDGVLFVETSKLTGPILEPDKWQFDILGSGKDIHMGFTDKTFVTTQQLPKISPTAMDKERIWPSITIVKGQFRRETNKLTLKHSFGSVMGSSIQDLNAVIDVNQTPDFKVTTGPTRIDLDKIMGWLNSHEEIIALISPVKTLTGLIITESVMIQGPLFDPRKWQFDINGSARDITLGFGPGKKEFKTISGSFNATDTQIQIKNLDAEIQDLSLFSHAVDSPVLDSFGLPLHIFEASLSKTKDKSQFLGKVSFPSGPQLSFDLAGKNLADLYPRLLMLKDEDKSDAMIIINRDTSSPLLSVEGVFNTQTLEKILIKGSFLHNLVVSFTAGYPVVLFTDAASNLHFSTDKINLDSLLANENNSKKSRQQPLFNQKTLYLKTRQLTYQKMIFSDISAVIKLDKDKTQIQILTAHRCGLAFTGVVELHHGTTEKQIITDFTIQPLENQDLATMLPCLLKNSNIIDGPYSFTCKLSGQASSDMIARQQNGQVTLNARNGRIHKWTFLSRLLSVLNILHFTDITKQGIGYRSITIEADIKDSVIHLKKAIVDADNMALIFSGWIDPVNDKMDVTCLVAPFKTIDTIIKHLPVVNTMLSGRLLSFPAKATGSMTDPIITSIHPSAVGKGLVNMLEDIMKTPEKIFKETK
jgi:AsmA-like C-terminal region